MSELTFRFACEADTPLILHFIRELAEYEQMADQVVTNEEQLRAEIFEKKGAEVIFALENGKEVGFALFFHNFSTFLGRRGLYLEDLFVLPEYRGKGYGKGLLRQLARIALERGCGRLEWWCLDWNKPSIDFYRALGAKQWTNGQSTVLPAKRWRIWRNKKRSRTIRYGIFLLCYMNSFSSARPSSPMKPATTSGWWLERSKIHWQLS